MKKIRFLIFFVLCFTVTSIWADQCTQGISNIYQSIQENNISKSWDLASLKQQLGEPQQVTPGSTNMFYQWQDFLIWTSTKEGQASVGTYPGLVNVKDVWLPNAIKALGPPLQKKIVNLSAYTWQCGNKSQLIATAADDGTLLNIKGSNCTNQTCQPFAIVLQKDVTKQLFDKAVAENGERIQNLGYADWLHNYNKFFNISLPNLDAYRKDVLPRIENYYKQLRSCVLGKYDYGVIYPGADKVTVLHAEILGIQNQQCVVRVTSSDDNSVLMCKYPSEALSVFDDQGATDTVRGSFSSPVAMTISKYCKYQN